MSNINHAVVAGNVTRDPELRATKGGTAVLGFGIACNESRKNQQTGEWEDYPNFFEVTVFGTRAESLGKIIHKGMKVTVDGKLHYSSWEKDGQKRSKVEIVANEVELPPRQRPADGSSQSEQPMQPAQAAEYLGVDPDNITYEPYQADGRMPWE